MAGAISLEGVARVWEQEADLRTRFRDKRRLFFDSKSGSCDPKCTVHTAAENVQALRPLLIQMGLAKQKLFSISMVEMELLDHYYCGLKMFVSEGKVVSSVGPSKDSIYIYRHIACKL